MAVDWFGLLSHAESDKVNAQQEMHFAKFPFTLLPGHCVLCYCCKSCQFFSALFVFT